MKIYQPDCLSNSGATMIAHRWVETTRLEWTSKKEISIWIRKRCEGCGTTREDKETVER